MGEVYTNSDGLVEASAGFMDAAGKIDEVKDTLYTALNDFTKDMLGNALEPMGDCMTQMDGELFCVNDKFSAISELLMNILYTRSEIDSALGMNAAGKLVSSIGVKSLSH